MKIIKKMAFCVLLIAIALLSGCVQVGVLSGEEITRLPDEQPRSRGGNDSQHYNTAPDNTPPVVSYLFDPESNMGMLSVDITNRGIEVRKSVIKNIGEICSTYNVTLEAGKAPPKGARYEILGESVDNGILTVKFMALF